MGLVFRHPEPGEMVGEYRILEKIGSGGSGTVFKAERGGLFFVVKMLRSGELRPRERREIHILLQLENPCVARFRACDRWLDPEVGIPYIVMDFVPGLTLEEFANVENPSARQSARIVLETALTLGEVHVQGVFHRDLKPENLIIKGKNERPVLIDFGLGTYAGAPVLTPYGLPPGTYEFRSPEAYLFNRSNPELVHYEFSATDELWALGVIFYWLLTNVLPFGERYDWEGGGLSKRIIQQTPMAPHVLNPRVPRALSDLCMKMLEKKPEHRYASTLELCAALEGAMTGAEADAGWDLPLFDPDAPDAWMSEEEPSLVDANEDEATRMMRKWARGRPRRGRKPKQGAGLAPNQDDILAVVAEPGADDVSAAEHGQESEAPAAPAPREAPRATPAPRPPVSRRRSRALGAAGLALGVLGAVLFAGSLLRPAPHTSSEVIPTRQAESGLEVAPSARSLDPSGGEGAEPATDSISAPVMITMHSKDDSGEKLQEKKTKGLGRVARVIGTGLACKMLTGCPAPQYVRPTPEPAPCPAGAVETMQALGLEGEQPATFHLTAKDASNVTVKEGNTTLSLVGNWGKLPDYTLLSGRLIFGEGRVYGRLTEAKARGGDTFKVCLEVRDVEGGRGVIREPGGGGESARVFSTVNVRAVSSFK